MKKKIMLAIAAMLVLGLTIVVFAYNTTNHSNYNKAMECCCKGKDSCPMKNKNESASADKKDCCDSPDCCCKGGDSCPMKKQQTETSSQTVDTQNVTVVTSAEDCCKKDAPCCKNGGGACCKKKS